MARFTSHGGGISTNNSNGDYYINYRDVGGVSRRKRTKATSIAEAKEIKKSIEVEITKKKRELEANPQIAIDESKLCKTVDELAHNYFSGRETKDNKHEWNRYLLRVSPIIGRSKLPLSIDEAERLLGSLKVVVSKQTNKQLSPKSINIIIDSCRAMYGRGLKKGWISSGVLNPFVELEGRPKVDNSRKRVLSVEEVELLVDACDSRMYKLMVTMAFRTGARPISYLGLRLEDIDVVTRDVESDNYMKPKLIHFRAVKGGGSYAIPVSKWLVKLLWARVLELVDDVELNEDSKWIFPSSRNKRSAVAHATVSDYLQPRMNVLFNGSSYSSEFTTFEAKKVGMPTVSDTYKVILYTLRHSSASHIVEHTNNVHTAMKLLNHSNIKTTMGYVKASDKILQEAVDL